MDGTGRGRGAGVEGRSEEGREVRRERMGAAGARDASGGGSDDMWRPCSRGRRRREEEGRRGTKSRNDAVVVDI